MCCLVLVRRHCQPCMPQASLAQLAEHALRKRMVMGSIPIGGRLRNAGGRHFTTASVVFHQCVGVCVLASVCLGFSVCLCASVCLFAFGFWSSCCLAAWSSGMIPGLGPRGPGFNSRSGPSAQHACSIVSDSFACGVSWPLPVGALSLRHFARVV